MPREYRFFLNWDDEVVISTSEHSPEWRLTPSRRWWKPNRIPRGDAVLTDPEGNVRCVVRRLGRFARPRYALLAGEDVVGTIDRLNLLRTRYRIAFADGRTCEFHTPMFSVHFIATAGGATVAQVRVLRTNLWAVHFQPGEDRPELLATFARILWARWRSE